RIPDDGFGEQAIGSSGRLLVPFPVQTAHGGADSMGAGERALLRTARAIDRKVAYPRGFDEVSRQQSAGIAKLLQHPWNAVRTIALRLITGLQGEAAGVSFPRVLLVTQPEVTLAKDPV